MDDELLAIVRMLADGLTNSQIGAALFLAEATVAHRLTKLMTACGARNRTNLVYRSIQKGWLEVVPKHRNPAP